MKSMYLFLVLLSVITACTQASSLLDVDNLTESAFTDVVRDTPKDITVLNGYKKAKQMLNVEWTPLLNAIDSIPDRWGTGYYEPGVKRTGVPYSAVLETHTYIPQNISFYSFVSAVNNPYSLLYTENVSGDNSRSAVGKTYHGHVPADGQRGTFMGSTCSVLIGYCLGFRVTYGAGEMFRRTDLFVPIIDQSAQGVELMDILLNAAHAILVTEVWRTRMGEVVRIKTIEAVGNVRERDFTAEDFNYFIVANGYKITRYKDLYKNTEYRPSSVVAVTDEGEPAVSPVFNSDICTFKGDKCSFAEGETIRINFFDGDYAAMEIYNGNDIISTISDLDSSLHYVDLTSMDLSYGKYKARMIKSDNSYSDYTYWEILDCGVFFDKKTYTISVSSNNAVARQAKYVRVSGNIKQRIDMGDISNGNIEFVPTFDVDALTEKVYVVVEFIGDYGGVISDFIDTGLY